MNRGVFSRSMFNRNARNKLYNMGGLASVRKFANGGLPLGIFEEMYQKSLKAGDRTGLENLAMNRNVSREMRDRANQASRNLLSQQIQSRANQISDSSGFNLPKGLPSLRNITNFVFPKLFANDTTQNQNTGTAQNEASTAAEALNNLTSSSVTSTGVDQNFIDKRAAEKNALADIEEDPKNILDNREKFTEDFESEAGATDIPFKGESSVEDEEPLVRKLPEVPSKKPKPLVKTEILKKDLDTISTEIKTNLDGTEDLNKNQDEMNEDGLTNKELNQEGVELSQQVKDLTKTYNPESKNPEEVLSFNDKLLEITGAKDEKKPIKSLKERAELNKQLYKDFFGEDPEDEKRTAALNMAFAGFAAAAGESPHALQNFAKAGMEFTKRTAASAEKSKARKEKINMFALTNALQDERSEKSWEREMNKWEKGIKYDWLKTVKGSDDQKDMVAARLLANKENVRAQILASKSQLSDKLALKEKLTKFQVESRENIATVNAELKKRQLDQNIENLNFQERKFLLTQALTKDIASSKNRASMLNTLLSNFDDASTLAFFQMQEELGSDADINKIFGGEFLAKVAKIAETLPKDEKETKLTDSLEGYVAGIMKGVTQDPQKFSELLSQAEKAYPDYIPSQTNSDQDTVLNYLKNQFDAIQTLGKSS